MKSVLKKILGVCCILVGVAFGVLPVVPGVLLVLVGLELLGLPLVPWEKIKNYGKSFRRNKEEQRPTTDAPPDRNELI